MITIEYIQTTQSCRITTDVVDKNWNQIRFQYNQISDQSEVFESGIELPWHSFISNLEILSLAINVYGIKITFSSEAQALFDEGIKKKSDIQNIDQLPQLSDIEIEDILSAKGFLRRLTKEQIRNVSKLSRLNSGATFSVPGAGKTTEAFAFYLLHKKDNQGLLVICPKNAFPAWEEQLSLCLGSNAPRIRRLTQGIEKIESDLNDYPNDILLISYQQFIRTVSSIAKHLQKTQSYVFVDESHRIKGGDRTDTGKQIKRIAHLPVGKLIMSGTPMPNAIKDLLPQYSFLFPSDGEINENNIIEKIRRVYVRTTKNELLNPTDFPINTIRTEIPLNEPQKNLYNLIRSEELRQLSGISNNDKRLYRQLSKSYMRLLQVTSNPSLLLKSLTSYPDALRETIEYGDSNKIKYVAIKARQLAKEGKKVLIWSGFVENVESITQMLSDLGAKCIHGGVEAGSDDEENTREKIVKDFHDDPDMFVLVANPAACSEGISLHTVCHHAIYIDRNYNASQYLQSRDRIHRLGLEKGTITTIEIVHSPKSIDDLVDSRLNDKIRRMAEVLDDESLRIEPVTVELDEDGFDEEDAKQLLKHLKGQV
jgi:SNF2 family DNA or RNA helicase